MKNTRIHALVELSLLIALILIFAFIPNIGYIRLPGLPIQATLIHIPVIVGSILLGSKAGAFLGFIFGLTSLINNTTAPNITSFCFTPFIGFGSGMTGSWLSLIICFVPRVLCGIIPHYVYSLMKKRPRKIASKLSLPFSGVAGSLTNTILVMGMIYIFFGQQYAAAKEIAFEAIFGVILTTVLTNGVFEAVIAAIVTFAIVSALQKIHK